MPLILLFTLSFERSLKNLSFDQREIIKRIVETLTVYYENNCNLTAAQMVSPRFFYKQLYKPFYEAGIESKLRIVIRRDGLEGVAILAGHHDQIKRFLANQ